ncbi:MAG: arylesterase [Rhodospirillaceae bacterium]|nr:arylesterase [Rhodospirillaceae bacterium]|tara:strand:+ start:5203 stop:6150 length:948 start_codon:yes stop_codon:yes gene_type:complete
MSTRHLLDPDLLAMVDAFPDLSFHPGDLVETRARLNAAMANQAPLPEGVTREELWVPGLTGEPDVRCLLYRHGDTPVPSPVYLHLHGGGYVSGSPDSVEPRNAQVAAECGVIVVSVDYRLTPEHPFPAAHDDAYAILAWLNHEANALGIDPRRIGVGGESAGGGLAASLALTARDRAEFSFALQVLVNPMLDHRSGGSEAPGDRLLGEFVWRRKDNQDAWAAYLGGKAATAPAVPALAESLAGLPTTWLSTAALDLFLDEDLTYARRLLSSGVTTELRVYPAACHSFSMAADAAVSRRFDRDHRDAIARLLGGLT